MGNSPIGLIGVGLLGTALAERMFAAGFAVIGFDLEPTRKRSLNALGGGFAASPQDVAAACDTVVLCLPDSSVVAEVVDELTGSVRREMLFIDATTGDPEQTEAMAKRLADREVGYVDATIAGSSEQVRRGEAVTIVGGTERDVARANPILRSWGPRSFHVGPPASGARLKLVVNLVLGLNRAALAEGLSLAKACGIDPAAALEVLKATPAYSAAMDTKGTKMVQREFSPEARLAQHAKDVRLIRALALRCGAPTPLSDAHAALLQAAIALGLGNADNSAVIEAYGSVD